MMKNRFLLFVFALLVGLNESEAQVHLCIAPAGSTAISTQQDLDKIRNNMAGKYFLCNDLALTGNFTPLGWTATGSSIAFSGIFDGNGKTIKNLKVSVSASYPNNLGLGLFSSIAIQGTVKDLQLENVDVYGAGFLGALAGVNNGTVRNVTVTGTGKIEAYDPDPLHFSGNVGGLIGEDCGYIRNASVDGSMQVIGRHSIGGLVGYASCSFILDSHSSANVTDTPGPWFTGLVGGLVGSLYSDGVILKSSASGEVRGTDFVGGLVGANGSKDFTYGGTILESFALGNVYGNNWVGGLAGHAYISNIQDSYARGNVTGTYGRVGGLIGEAFAWQNGPTYVGNCYSAGKVNGQLFVGGVIGKSSFSFVSNSYFNQTLNPNLPSDDRGIGKTEQELKTLGTYFPQWDMTYLSKPNDSAWKIAFPGGTDFPILGWQLH